MVGGTSTRAAWAAGGVAPGSGLSSCCAGSGVVPSRVFPSAYCTTAPHRLQGVQRINVGRFCRKISHVEAEQNRVAFGAHFCEATLAASPFPLRMLLCLENGS